MRGEPVGEPEPAFDPASLPSIEKIDIGTDIRGFLQTGVPPELTLAALRRAWTSDPSIRDFIGIAENQWDFNDPTSIFGFGPMRATDNSQALLAQALGKVKDIAENAMTTQGSTPVADPLESSSVRSGVNATAESRTTAEAEGAPVVAAAEDPVMIAVETPRRPRGHGGALPK
jgi:hypothetical protein